MVMVMMMMMLEKGKGNDIGRRPFWFFAYDTGYTKNKSVNGKNNGYVNWNWLTFMVSI